MDDVTKNTKNLESLRLGHGDLEFEVFLEPTCPFSKRAFDKLQPLLSAVGEDKLTINIRFVSQPWHLFSAIVTRCVLAASATERGYKAGLNALNKVFENREEFVCEDHCAGPNLEMSPSKIVSRISQLSALDFSTTFELDEVTQALKWHAKYARQNGVHSSPSFAVNGLLNDAIGSGQSINEWAQILGLSDT